MGVEVWDVSLYTSNYSAYELKDFILKFTMRCLIMTIDYRNFKEKDSPALLMSR